MSDEQVALGLRASAPINQRIVLPAGIANGAGVYRNYLIHSRDQEVPVAVRDWMRQDARYAAWFEDGGEIDNRPNSAQAVLENGAAAGDEEDGSAPINRPLPTNPPSNRQGAGVPNLGVGVEQVQRIAENAARKMLNEALDNPPGGELQSNSNDEGGNGTAPSSQTAETNPPATSTTNTSESPDETAAPNSDEADKADVVGMWHERMTLPDLRAFAEQHAVTLTKDDSTKAAVIAKLRAAKLPEAVK